jgi:ankyrin repeat protein
MVARGKEPFQKNGLLAHNSSLSRVAPLHLASFYGKLEVARLLLERGVDIDAEDDEGNTAYQIALKRGHEEITQLLAGHGAENKT